jgi:hypothetical protein
MFLPPTLIPLSSATYVLGIDDIIIEQMNRRRFVTNMAGTAGGLFYGSRLGAADIKRVLVMFKCHLDVGFVDTQSAIIAKYFQQYYPRAMEIAAKLRQAGGDRYVWTTGSWLLFEYLEQAGKPERQRMEKAIAAGDIAWHALPFSWQTELMDRSLITGALGFSKSLDRRFGRTTTGAKMTDVPGHSRGLIAPLAESGVTLLDIGVNSASTPPDVPPIFIWKDPQGASLLMLYHRKAYGGVVPVPGSDLAVAVEVRDDNSGPHTVDEIHKIYADLRQQFPGAKITASNLTEIANAVVPFRSHLPVVTQEIGDTWIYGVASDPVKVARYRELLRLRHEWITTGKFRAGDATDLAFLRRYSLAVEHTWGTDTKTWLDFDHYTPKALAEMLDKPKYKTVTGSWVEKRNDIDQGVAALPAGLRTQAEQRLFSLRPVAPATSQLKPHDAASPLDGEHFTVKLDPVTGAIQHLRNKATGRNWADATHPLALFSYQTLSKSDYDRFLASYITLQTDWAPKDFGKPNIEHFGARSKIWTPKLIECKAGQDEHGVTLHAHLQIEDQAAQRSGLVAWPEELYLEIHLPSAEPAVHIQFSWFHKQANRLPEAMWLTFQPNAPEVRNWSMDKVGRPVSPFDVVPGGNRHMHALNALSYRDASGHFNIETMDAPLVVLGEKSPIYFSKDQPEIEKGLHFCLFNNGWGTNYVQWFAEDMRFRFRIRG